MEKSTKSVREGVVEAKLETDAVNEQGRTSEHFATQIATQSHFQCRTLYNDWRPSCSTSDFTVVNQFFNWPPHRHFYPVQGVGLKTFFTSLSSGLRRTCSNHCRRRCCIRIPSWGILQRCRTCSFQTLYIHFTFKIVLRHQWSNASSLQMSSRR